MIRSEGDHLSANVTNTDPAYRKEGSLGVALETFENRVARAEPLDDSEAARRAADLTNLFVEGAASTLERSDVNERRRTEGRLPANLVLTRDGGDHVPRLTPIKERFGPGWGCVVEMPVERGIALVLGMAPVDAPTSLPRREQYGAWAELASEAIEGYDALYIHIKGPDVPAHDGLPRDKLEVCEDIDQAFFAELLPRPAPDADRRDGRPFDLLPAQGAHRRPGPAAGERPRGKPGRHDVLRRARRGRRGARPAVRAGDPSTAGRTAEAIRATTKAATMGQSSGEGHLV